MNCSEKVKNISVCWGYEEENGPEVWGRLNPEYRICDTGIHQSPIDIVDPIPTKLPAIIFTYQPTSLNIGNTGNTIEVVYPKGSWIEVNETKYHLLQFHFHAPSEHTVVGNLSDMEMHFVHKSENDALAVIAVLIKNGRYNTAFEPIWQYLPSVTGESEQIADVVFNAMDLLPSTRHTYRYDGSLTTPPCSEGVKWFVMTTPIEIAQSQIAAFKAIFNGNNRPTQPLNGRELLVDVIEDR